MGHVEARGGPRGGPRERHIGNDRDPGIREIGEKLGIPYTDAPGPALSGPSQNGSVLGGPEIVINQGLAGRSFWEHSGTILGAFWDDSETS